MNVDAYISNLETLAIRAVIFEIAVTISITIIMFWLTYFCIRAAVRDGIVAATPRTRSTGQASPPAGYKWTLVKDEANIDDIRAD
ncbi:hypothetical protein ACIGHN_11550 [Acidovorax sp. NPDC077693]|uniref:hypothetical protein n=1 Tax=unclassified Acidovorax TaxID=2684926 RepID=UPI0037C6614F